MVGDVILSPQCLDCEGTVETLVGKRSDPTAVLLNVLPEPVGDPTAPEVDANDQGESYEGAEAQPRIGRGYHNQGTDQQEGDSDRIGKWVENTGSLVDIGICDGEQVADGLAIEPGHP